MGLEIAGDERTYRATAKQQRAAAVTVAARIGVEHPHELDDLMPRLAGNQLAHDPAVAAGVRELLAALGLLPDEPPEKPDAKHGTPHRYRVGCRCEECRAANTERCGKQRQRRAADPAAADRAGHGSPSTYKNYGCRCRPCTEAHTAQIADRRRARTEAAS